MPSLGRRAPNPFYVFLMVVSTVFVVTILAYLVAPYAAEGEAAGAGAAGWINRHAPLALAIELGLMILSALLAIATDHLFATKQDGASDRG